MVRSAAGHPGGRRGPGRTYRLGRAGALIAAVAVALAVHERPPIDAQVRAVRPPPGPVAPSAVALTPARAQAEVPGARVAVHTAAELQAALNRAAPGATIVLDAGVRFAGNFILPSRPAGAAAVTVTSSAHVPPAGERIDPAVADLLATLVSTNNQPVIDAATGVHGWNFIGLTFRATGGATNDIVRIGYGTEATAALYPSDVTFDRVVIRGDPRLGAKRGILANAHRITLVNSDIRDIFRAGQDTTTFGCFNCGTGYTLKNNHLEAGAEVVIFGGAESVARTIATDVLVEGNVLTRPLAWRTGDYQVKNLFELKEGLHVVVRGNVMYNNWVAAQPGTAIVITPRDVGKSIQDVLFENNVLYNTGAGFSIASHDDHTVTPVATSRIVLRNNLVILDEPTYGGDGRLMIMSGAPRDVTFDHNTVIQLPGSKQYGSLVAAYAGVWPTASGRGAGGPVTGLVFTNNAAPNGEYGFIANGSMNGAGFPIYFPGAVMTGNVLAGYKALKDLYPGRNRYPTQAEFQSMFVNYAAGDYRPSRSMPSGNDGKPAGVDFASLPPFTR
jgi:hypothetical protein